MKLYSQCAWGIVRSCTGTRSWLFLQSEVMEKEKKKKKKQKIKQNGKCVPRSVNKVERTSVQGLKSGIFLVPVCTTVCYRLIILHNCKHACAAGSKSALCIGFWCICPPDLPPLISPSSTVPQSYEETGEVCINSYSRYPN